MSPAAQKVVTHLIELCGDTFEIRSYERKTALVCEEEPFDFPDDVRAGDALIVFTEAGSTGYCRKTGTTGDSDECDLRQSAAGNPQTPDPDVFSRRDTSGRFHRCDWNGTQFTCAADRFCANREV